MKELGEGKKGKRERKDDGKENMKISKRKLEKINIKNDEKMESNINIEKRNKKCYHSYKKSLNMRKNLYLQKQIRRHNSYHSRSDGFKETNIFLYSLNQIK